MKIQNLLHGASKMLSAVIYLRISYVNVKRDSLAMARSTARMWTNVRCKMRVEKIVFVRIPLEIIRARVSRDTRETHTNLWVTYIHCFKENFTLFIHSFIFPLGLKIAVHCSHVQTFFLFLTHISKYLFSHLFKIIVILHFFFNFVKCCLLFIWIFYFWKRTRFLAF